MNIIGEVKGRTCVITDDIVDTAGTLCNAAGALKERGAKRVVAYITHPVLSGAAVERIMNSALDELVVTDTIPLSAAAEACPKIRQVSCAAIIGENAFAHRPRRLREQPVHGIRNSFFLVPAVGRDRGNLFS